MLGEIVSAMNNHTKTTVLLKRLKIFITILIKFTVLLKAQDKEAMVTMDNYQLSLQLIRLILGFFPPNTPLWK